MLIVQHVVQQAYSPRTDIWPKQLELAGMGAQCYAKERMVEQGDAAPCLDGACSPINFRRHSAVVRTQYTMATRPRQLRVVATVFATSLSASAGKTMLKLTHMPRRCTRDQ